VIDHRHRRTVDSLDEKLSTLVDKELAQRLIAANPELYPNEETPAAQPEALRAPRVATARATRRFAIRWWHLTAVVGALALAAVYIVVRMLTPAPAAHAFSIGGYKSAVGLMHSALAVRHSAPVTHAVFTAPVITPQRLIVAAPQHAVVPQTHRVAQTRPIWQTAPHVQAVPANSTSSDPKNASTTSSPVSNNDPVDQGTRRGNGGPVWNEQPPAGVFNPGGIVPAVIVPGRNRDRYCTPSRGGLLLQVIQLLHH
jgi:hypothetical protein